MFISSHPNRIIVTVLNMTVTYVSFTFLNFFLFHFLFFIAFMQFENDQQNSIHEITLWFQFQFICHSRTGLLMCKKKKYHCATFWLGCAFVHHGCNGNETKRISAEKGRRKIIEHIADYIWWVMIGSITWNNNHTHTSAKSLLLCCSVHFCRENVSFHTQCPQK